MSGVFGALDSRRRSRIDPLLVQMGAVMSHREWFVAETWRDGSEGVGLGRIGIGTFNRERQPVCSDDQSVVVFLSGEIHNATQLGRGLRLEGDDLRDNSDIALVLRLYEREGTQFIHELQGAFVLAIWDRTRHELFIANDRFGLYPLYYAHYDGKLVFAPEAKASLCDPGFHRELDLTALAEYVRFQHLLGDKTFFVGLKLLPNASFLSYDLHADRLTIRPYWDFSEIPQLPANLTFGEAAEEAGRRLKAAVDRLTEGDQRLGVYLSGGVDSRAILGLIGKDRFPVTTITFGQRTCRDVAYASRIAAIAKTSHHYFEFSSGEWVAEFADLHLELTEGFHSWIHAHGISILEPVRSLIDVNLSGFGGGQEAIDWEDPGLLSAQDDEAFLVKLFRLLSQETTWPSIDDAEERLLYSSGLSSQMRGLAFESLRAELARYEHLPYGARAAYFAICNPDRRLFQYYTVFHRSHIEQRFPFFDYDYLEFVYALPPDMLYKRRLRRAIILERMRPLARVPYDRDDLPITGSSVPYLSAKLIQKGKSFVNRYIGPVFPERRTLYADYEGWLRNELREWGERILLGERTFERQIFDPAFLHSLWRRHQSGLEMHTIGKIAPLMTYEMVLRRYWDQEASAGNTAC